MTARPDPKAQSALHQQSAGWADERQSPAGGLRPKQSPQADPALANTAEFTSDGAMAIANL